MRLGVLLLAWLGAAPSATADIYGQATVATDYLFRGASQTMSGPAIQAEVGVELDNGWYGYAWASNVRFTDGNTPDDGARVELDVGGGYVIALTQSLTLEIGVTAYVFPDTEPDIDYDYAEWHTTIGVDDAHRLTVGYSDNVFNSGTGGTYYEFGTVHALAGRLDLCVALGHYDLERAYDLSYRWGEVAIAGSSALVDWRLSYFTTSDSAGGIYEASTIDDRFVLALSLPF